MASTLLPEMNKRQRVISTMSRIEVDQTLLPSGENSSQALVASHLLPPPVNVFVPSKDKVQDDRIKHIINANPLSTALKVHDYSSVASSITDKARLGAARRTGKMLDYCNRHAKKELGDQTRKDVPGAIAFPNSTRATKRVAKKHKHTTTTKNTTKNTTTTKQQVPSTAQPKTKVKLSKSQRMGRQRLSTDRGEAYLHKTIGRADLINTSKPTRFSMETLQQWFHEIPEEFRVCKLPPSPNKPVQLKPLGLNPKQTNVNMRALIQQDEAQYQNKYKQRQLKKKQKKGKRNIGKSVSKTNKTNKTNKKSVGISKDTPSTYFRVNKSGLSRADQSFDALTKVVVGFDTFERGAKPKRIPARLAQFWAQHEASGVGPKILSDGFTLSEFDISVKKLGQLEVSTEMMQAMKDKVLQPGGVGGTTKSMTDIWNDFWVDEVGSELAAPLDSSVFIKGGSGLEVESATREAPAFLVDDSTATAHLPYASRRFAFANHAHVAASRIQKVYHKRRHVLHFCSTKISSVFRGFKIRKAYRTKKMEMHASALLIATVFRGRKARKYVGFLKTQGWNHIAILCQRCIRRWLAKQEVKRRRFARTYNAATNIQRVWRGIWGRQKFKEWKMYVRDRSAKSIQNMVRWYHFRTRKEEYEFNLILAVEDIQRMFRGYSANKIVQHLRARVRAAQDMQRIWRSFAGRRRFRRKENIVRTACITIQVRLRGILARIKASDVRTTALTVERERTKLEEEALARRLEETKDFMVTKAGKIEHKLNKQKFAVEKRKGMASKLLMSQRKSRLLRLKNGFQMVDYKSTGLIDVNQFEELMLHVLHAKMTAKQLEAAWSKTNTAVAQRGGYRLSDLKDRRELEELVEWYESGLDRTLGWKAAVRKISKKTSKMLSCKPGTVSRMGMKTVFARTRLERLFVFRDDRPPPFSCPTCTKRFVFSYELERHMAKGKVPGCPSKYYCPVLDD